VYHKNQRIGINISLKNIVITGASKGIGKALAFEFLKSGCSVYISGRNPDTLQEAVKALSVESENSNIHWFKGDVTRMEDLIDLWRFATAEQPVDIWINNAGMNHMRHQFHELEASLIAGVINTNITGTLLGSRVAIEGMLKQGSGMVYNMEGFGSDGRIIKGMTTYGTSKTAVRYFTKSLIKEYKGSPVNIGSISPGMVVTDMLLEPLRKEPGKNRDALRVFHILADPADRVTPWLVGKILGSSKHGVHFAWLTPLKITGRFIMGMFKKRKVKGLPDFLSES
jgi:short-subunit dehydrogenase